MAAPKSDADVSDSDEKSYATLADECEFTGYLSLAGDEVCPLTCDQQSLLPNRNDYSGSTSTTRFVPSGSSGRAYQFIGREQVAVIVWGRRITYTPAEFQKEANNIRNQLRREAALLRSRLADSYRFFRELRDEQWFVSRLSSFFNAVDIEPYKELGIETEEVLQSLLGSTINCHVLYKAGLRLVNIRKRADELDSGVARDVSRSARNAERIATSLSVVEDLSFEILKKANAIYAIGNPIRKAMGEIGVMVLRAGADSLGTYMAFKDRKHVLKNLYAILLKEVPAILKGIAFGYLRRGFPSLGGPSHKKLEGIVEALCRSVISFVFEIIMEACKDDSKVDQDDVLEALFKSLESAVMQITGVMLGVERLDPPPTRVRYITYLVMTAVADSFTPLYLEARDEAKQRNESLTEVLIAKLPTLIIEVFKSLLVELTGSKMEKRWGGGVAQREWEEQKSKAKDLLMKVKNSVMQPPPAELSGEALPPVHEDGSEAVGVVTRESKGKVEDTAIVPPVPAAPGAPPPPPPPTMPPRSTKEGEFKGLGLRLNEYEESEEGRRVVAKMRQELSNTPLSELGMHEALNSYVSSSLASIEINQPALGTKFFKLVPFGAEFDKSKNYGWWLTREQLDYVERNPLLLKHVLLALPRSSWGKAAAPEEKTSDVEDYLVEKYDVLEVSVKTEGAVVFKSELAPTVQEPFEGESAKIYQMGGRLKTAPGQDGKRSEVKTEQIMILSGECFTEVSKVKRDHPIEGFGQKQSFVIEAIGQSGLHAVE